MSDNTGHKRTLVGELVSQLQARDLPLVAPEAEMEELVERLAKFRHNRLLYVVDENNRLLGTISLGILLRHYCAPSHEPRAHTRVLMHMITVERASEMMQKHPLVTTVDEEVGLILKRMIHGNVKEVPVLDDQKRIIADLTIVDLLAFLIPHRKDKEDS